MTRRPRATVGLAADRHASELAERLGLALRDARVRAGLKQAVAGARAGISQATWSKLERNCDARFTLATWDRAAFAVGARLEAFVRGGSAADLPRDAVHLRNQELVIRTAKPGAWLALAEEALDRDVGRSCWADVLLQRHRPTVPAGAEYALMEVIDWFADVGAPLRDWGRRLDALERYSVARMRPGDGQPAVSGCWLVRATRRNRQLVGAHSNLFRSRFPGSGRAWLAALTDPAAPMPATPALLWVSVDGTRLIASRLGS